MSSPYHGDVRADAEKMAAMTSPRDTLLPCPFCGGEAERLNVEGDMNDPNFGGSCICCQSCGASSALHFDRKENLESSWNHRAFIAALPTVPAGEGWVLVPREPTEDMLQAYIHSLDAFDPGISAKFRRTVPWRTKATLRWRKMLTAAPTASLSAAPTADAGDTLTGRLASFFEGCAEMFFDGGDIEGGHAQDMAVSLGLLRETTYDPEVHGENNCDASPGDPWFVFADDVDAAIRHHERRARAALAASTGREG